MAVFSVAATIDLSTITQEALIKKMGMIYIICLLSACIPGFLNGTKGDNKYGENPLDKDKMK
jgi:uncharacterized membrane protein YhaH (DUF805 family)